MNIEEDRNMQRHRLALVAAITLILTGCASLVIQSRVNQRLEEIKVIMEQLMGKSKKVVVMEIGAPTNVQKINDLEVYTFYRSYGTKSKGGVWVNPYNPYVAINTRRVYEAYDLIRAYFEKNIMIKWDCYVQR